MMINKITPSVDKKYWVGHYSFGSMQLKFDKLPKILGPTNKIT